MRMMKLMMVGLTAVVALLASSWLSAAATPGVEAPIFTHKGTVDVIDLEANRLVISGLGFEVPLDATVTIRGGVGAFTLLQQGMKAEVVYYEYPDTRVAISIDQLPDNVEIEQF